MRPIGPLGCDKSQPLNTAAHLLHCCAAMWGLGRLSVFVMGVALMGGCSSDGSATARAGLANPAIRAGLLINSERGDDEARGKSIGKDEQRGRKRGRHRDTPVYLDGKRVGSLRFGELPPTMPVVWHPLDGDRYARRFAFVDYLAALGVDLAKVNALHLHGGRGRITVIDGNELRRVGDAVQFQFSKSTGGQPRYKHRGPVTTNTSIDKIRAVAVYVADPAPELKGGKLYVDGKRVKPLEDQDGAGGTRVYLDGRMVGALKRRAVGDSKEGVVLSNALRGLGVELRGVHTAHVVVRDAVAMTIPATKLMGTELKVTALRQSRGRLTIAGALDDKPVDAVLLFAKDKPIDRSGPPPSGAPAGESMGEESGDDDDGASLGLKVSGCGNWLAVNAVRRLGIGHPSHAMGG
jgi:hypothetical protein